MNLVSISTILFQEYVYYKPILKIILSLVAPCPILSEKLEQHNKVLISIIMTLEREKEVIRARDVRCLKYILAVVNMRHLHKTLELPVHLKHFVSLD